ncbi:MAG: hypothetical protein IH991_05790 [Planctomycetes bacterium]|nr:hypothetical protein [Planctomycetota bacterium]
MNDATCPPFPEALDRFQNFLASEGHCTELLWIFREDVVERCPRTYLRVPLRNDETLVELLYDEGLQRGLGIHLNVFCFLEDRPCCYVWLPKDEEDASYRMLLGLKVSIPADSDRRIVVPVKSRLRWTWLKCCGAWKSGPHWAADIPLCSSIQEQAP